MSGLVAVVSFSKIILRCFEKTQEGEKLTNTILGKHDVGSLSRARRHSSFGRFATHSHSHGHSHNHTHTHHAHPRPDATTTTANRNSDAPRTGEA